MRHELKTWPEFFASVKRGEKTFEVRIDDRGGYAIGDTLVLHEWAPTTGYTGESLERDVTYVLRDPKFGVTEGYVVMGIAPPQLVLERRRAVRMRIVDGITLVTMWGAVACVQQDPRGPLTVSVLLAATVLTLVSAGRQYITR